MSLNLFIALAFTMNLIILFFIKPVSGESFKPVNIVKSDIPRIVFKNFKLFDIGLNSVVETTLSGEFGEVFRDGSYRIRNVEIQYQNSEYIENIKSRYAYYSNSNIEAVDGVIYKRSDNTSIVTDKLSYDIENSYFYIPNRFVFKKNGTTIKGRTLIIHRDVGKISAFDVDAVLNR